MTERRSKHQKAVDEFHEKMGHNQPDSPKLPDKKTRYLRASLIMEEAFETINALGFLILPTKQPGSFVLVESGRERLIDIVDGCADTIYVTLGTLSACGVDDVAVMDEVCANNLEKFGPGHRIDEKGKLIKPPLHIPPDFGALLLRMRMDRERRKL